jgi:cytoskeletal protein RodZ
MTEHKENIMEAKTSRNRMPAKHKWLIICFLVVGMAIVGWLVISSVFAMKERTEFQQTREEVATTQSAVTIPEIPEVEEVEEESAPASSAAISLDSDEHISADF